jgi:PhoH-like ATPase
MINAKSKTFVLDTNVLLHNPVALFAFADNHVVIPMIVLEELDRFKSNNNELGRNSREVIRSLDQLRTRGSLRDGIPTESGGMIQVVLRYDELTHLLPGNNDNKILGCAHLLRREGHQVFFVSKDINARIKCDALGIPSADYENQKVNIDELHTGWISMPVEHPSFASLQETGSCDLDQGELHYHKLGACDFVVYNDGPDSARMIARYNSMTGKLTALPDHQPALYGVEPRSHQQRMAFDLLLDDDISLVTLVGAAGTGKTLLALAAGMHKVLVEGAYIKILVSRPIMPMGQDIGYLPGTKDEKLANWMGPIFDNLHFIIGQQEKDPDEVIKRMIDEETVAIEALTYIRGRSISNQYLIVDEAQNLSPHELKTIISRAGQDTKIVLTGDPYQIDNPYLDASSNGLSYVVERMRQQPLAGHVTLKQSERSELAGIAAELL